MAALRELLAFAKLSPPYVLVGHSLGGLYANLFARLFPQEVEGVVLLEATHPDGVLRLPLHQAPLTRALQRIADVAGGLFGKNPHAEAEFVTSLAQRIGATAHRQAQWPFPADQRAGDREGGDPAPSQMTALERAANKCTCANESRECRWVLRVQREPRDGADVLTTVAKQSAISRTISSTGITKFVGCSGRGKGDGPPGGARIHRG